MRRTERPRDGPGTPGPAVDTDDSATPIPDRPHTVSSWLLLLLITAFAGATLVWYGVGKSKETSENLLRQYQNLLSKARERKREGDDQDDDEQEQERDGEPAAPEVTQRPD